MNVSPELEQELSQMATKLVNECRMCHEPIGNGMVRVLLSAYAEGGMASVRMVLVCRKCHETEPTKVQELHDSKYSWS